MNDPIHGIERTPGTEPTVEQRKKLIGELMQSGVDVVDPDRTYVGPDVRVAPGVTLFPGTHLRGTTVIEADCRIGPDCWIEDTTVEAESVVRYSVLESARVRAKTVIGPYAHLRSGADVGPEARIGNFVEVKQARLHQGVKAGHLAYIGDATVGAQTNIGAGTITCNYDGQAKNRTVIEDGVFIGSNASLVAPVSVGRGAYVAAGSTITQDVPAAHTAFGRARQVNKSPKQPKEGNADDEQAS